MILVTGATGKVGGELAKLLAAAQAPARALVRDGANAAALAGLGLEVAMGNLDDPATLAPAFRGVERAFLLPANGPRQAEQGQAFLDAARAAGVRHVVKVSNFLPDPGSPNANARRHWQTNEALKASGMAWTLLRPNFFMQNLLMFAPPIREHGRFHLNAGNATVGMVDVRDVAALACACLLADGHDGQDYALTGPAAVSFQQAAEDLSAATGRPVYYVPLPSEAFRRHLLDLGMSDDAAGALTETYKGIGEGRFAAVTDTVARVAGRPPIAFERFARDFAETFRDAATTAAPAAIAQPLTTEREHP